MKTWRKRLTLPALTRLRLSKLKDFMRKPVNRRVQRIGETAKKMKGFVRQRSLPHPFTCLFSLAVALCFPPSAMGATEAGEPSKEQLASEARSQRQFATSAYLTDLHRAEKVTYALLKAGTPYCVQRRKYSVGIPPLAQKDLPQDLREGFADSMQAANERPVFLNITSDSPAGAAGVQSGDILLKMTDGATGKQVQPGWVLDRPSSTLVSNEMVFLEVQRGSSKNSLRMRPQLVCDMQLRLLRTTNLVADVGAGQIILSQGILRFVSNDDELAYLIANELIHEQLRLERSMRPKTAAGKSHEGRLYAADEPEADYLGAYLTASARFDIARAQNVWRRLASSQNKDSLASRHPLSPLRGTQIQAVSNEIRRKASAGEKQIPDRASSLPLVEASFRNSEPYAAQASNADKGLPAKEDPRLRVITDLPFIDNEGISGYQRFLDSPLRPRAFAIGPSKTSSRGAWSYKFGTNAAADALTHCSIFARGPCYLYAVDDKVVWNIETAVDQPQPNTKKAANEPVTQPRGTGFAKIDDVKAVPLPEEELLKYRAFLEKPSPRAFLITQEGQGLYWIGPAATHDALAHCARLTKPCWLYAVNNDVVWSENEAGRISRNSQLPAQNDESGFLEN